MQKGEHFCSTQRDVNIYVQTRINIFLTFLSVYLS